MKVENGKWEGWVNAVFDLRHVLANLLLYGLVERNYGGDAIIHIVSKEESGPNPTRINPRPDPRIAAITGGTGVMDEWIREP